MTDKQFEKILRGIDEQITKKMTHILAEEIPYMRNHKFKMEEEALRYKYDGLVEAREIIWDVERKHNIY